MCKRAPRTCAIIFNLGALALTEVASEIAPSHDLSPYSPHYLPDLQPWTTTLISENQPSISSKEKLSAKYTGIFHKGCGLAPFDQLTTNMKNLSTGQLSVFRSATSPPSFVLFYQGTLRVSC